MKRSFKITDIENELNSLKISIERISGKDRYETSLNIAKKIDEGKAISKVAIVNGVNGLADGVSVGSIAGMENMPIILSQKDSLGDSEKWINSKNITNSYVIGQNGVLSDSIGKKLNNSKRLGGVDRYDTNAKIIEEFYNTQKLENIFVAKSGMNKPDELIDALSAGALASKKKAPIVLAGPSLSDSQKIVLLGKEKNNLIQVGKGISQTAVGEVKVGSKSEVVDSAIKEIDKINETINSEDKFTNGYNSAQAIKDAKRNSDEAVKVIDTSLRNSAVQKSIDKEAREIRQEARKAKKLSSDYKQSSSDDKDEKISKNLDDIVETLTVTKDGEYRSDRIQRAIDALEDGKEDMNTLPNGDKKEDLIKSLEEIMDRLQQLKETIDKTEAAINQIEELKKQLEDYAKGGATKAEDIVKKLSEVINLVSNIPSQEVKAELQKIIAKVQPIIEKIKGLYDEVNGALTIIAQINKNMQMIKALLDGYKGGTLEKQQILEGMKVIGEMVNSLPDESPMKSKLQASLFRISKVVEALIKPDAIKVAKAN